MSEKSFVKLTETEIAERSRRLAHAVASHWNYSSGMQQNLGLLG